ncbi:hypothetical protein [Staphylococcus gallinarum]|nr:hypothetical protein [Staphylococcus gallinarum]MCW0984854.1 hypothetical protein [Staphylococcus gallinarum]
MIITPNAISRYIDELIETIIEDEFDSSSMYDSFIHPLPYNI